MKKIIAIVIALFALQVSAQEPKDKRSEKPDFTAEEIAQLQTKKMTLNLDLTKDQQENVAKINLEIAKERIAKKEELRAMREKNKGEKPSKEDILKMKNEMLDAQIANKEKMRRILNKEQLEKWSKHQNKKQAMHGKKKKMKKEHREQGKHKRHEEQKN